MNGLRGMVFGLALVLQTACNPYEPQEVANEAVAAFHARYNNGAYAEIFAEASPTFREEVPRHELQRLLVSHERNLGRVMRTEQREIAFTKQDNGPDLAQIDMRTEYEFGTVREQFIFSLGTLVMLENYAFEVVRHDPERLWQERGYTVAPPAALPGSTAGQPVDLPPEVLEQLTPEEAEQLRQAINQQRDAAMARGGQSGL